MCRAGLFCVFAVVLGLSLLTSLSAVAQEVPFQGMVVKDVQVRAGAGETFYVVGQLPQGAVVTVDEVIFGWHKIVSPPGTYSYISQEDLRLSSDGQIGSVVASRAPVKAASTQGPGDSYRRQIYLLQGDLVQIVDQEGGFFKIVPPNGAYVFLPPGSVERVAPGQMPDTTATERDAQGIASDSLQAETQVQAPQASDQESSQAAPIVEYTQGNQPDNTPQELPGLTGPPIQPGAGQPSEDQSFADISESGSPAVSVAEELTPQGQPAASSALPPETPASPESPEPPSSPVSQGLTTQSPAALTPQAFAWEQGEQGGVSDIIRPDSVKPRVQPISPQLSAAERWLQQSLVLPLEQQPIEQLLAQYEALWETPNIPLVDRKIIAARLPMLRHRASVVAALKDVQSARKGLSTFDVEQLKRRPVANTDPGAPARQYDSVGMLLASSVYNGVNLPRLFRIVELAQMRTIAYVRLKPSIAPATCLGKNVGIIGWTKFDPALKLDVIEVRELDILENRSGPAPGQPARQAPAQQVMGYEP